MTLSGRLNENLKGGCNQFQQLEDSEDPDLIHFGQFGGRFYNLEDSDMKTSVSTIWKILEFSDLIYFD